MDIKQEKNNSSNNTNRKISTKVFIFSFWPSFVWASIILVLSLFSGEKVNQLSIFKIQYADKIAHFGMYFIFSYLIMYGFKNFYLNDIVKHRIQAYIFALFISILFGGLMEILQMYLNLARSPEFNDFVADSVGTLLALLLFEFLDKIYRRVIAFIIS